MLQFSLGAITRGWLVALIVCAVLILMPEHWHQVTTAGVFVLVPGITTGTGTGTDFTGLNESLKNVYGPAMDNSIEKESEVADCFTKQENIETIDGPDGTGIRMGHIFSSGDGTGSILEDDYLPDNVPPTLKQSIVTIKQHTALVEMSGRAMRRVKQGPAAFSTWADEVLPRRAERLAFHKDRQWLGLGTGIVGRYNGNPDGTGDQIDAAFGIAGLEGAIKLIVRDMQFRAASNADGTTGLRAGVARITAIDYAANDRAGAFNTTVAGVTGIPTSAVDNDFIFHGSANVHGYGAREMMGLEGMIDDGTNLATYLGIVRADFPEFRSTIIDTSTAGLGRVLSEEVIDLAESRVGEDGGGNPDIILTSRSGRRSFWKSLKSDRIINDPRGTFEGGRAKLFMLLGDRKAEVKAARKVPDSRAYGIEKATMKRYKIGTGRWDDTDGSIWQRVVTSTGRRDAFYAVYIEEDEVACVAPSHQFKITNLLAA